MKRKKKIRNIPEQVVRTILSIVHNSQTSRNPLIKSISQRIQDEHFIGDTVYVNSDVSGKGIILDKYDDGTYLVERIDSKGKPINISLDKKNEMTYQEMCSNLKKIDSKKKITKQMIRSIIYESAIKGNYVNSPWIVHPALVDKYNITVTLSRNLQEKEEDYLSKLKNKKRKREEDDDDELPLTKKPRLLYIEDLEIVREDIKLCPDPKYDFEVPQACMSVLVTLWSFLNAFGNIIQIELFSIEKFIDHLKSKKSSFLITLHVQLFKLISFEKSFKIQEDDVKENNWEGIMIKILEVSNKDEERFSFILEILKSKGYFELFLDEKLFILDHLRLICSDIDPIIEEIKLRFSKIEDIKKEKKEIESSDKKMQVKEEMKEEVIKLHNMNREKKFEKMLNQVKVRFEPLGFDRYYNRYWWFGVLFSNEEKLPITTGRIYVEYNRGNVRMNESLLCYDEIIKMKLEEKIKKKDSMDDPKVNDSNKVNDSKVENVPLSTEIGQKKDIIEDKMNIVENIEITNKEIDKKEENNKINPDKEIDKKDNKEENNKINPDKEIDKKEENNKINPDNGDMVTNDKHEKEGSNETKKKTRGKKSGSNRKILTTKSLKTRNKAKEERELEKKKDTERQNILQKKKGMIKRRKNQLLEDY